MVDGPLLPVLTGISSEASGRVRAADFRVSHAVVFALGFNIDVSDPFAEMGQRR
jgi:hypothetical protein